MPPKAKADLAGYQQLKKDLSRVKKDLTQARRERDRAKKKVENMIKF